MTNSETNNTLRIAYNISLALIGVLLLLSTIWYRERVLFVDTAFFTFNILRSENFFIPEHRYGSLITQAWPLIGSYLHLPLKAILILYSASFYVFYFLVSFVVGRLMKQYALGILLACYLTLIVSDSYFWPNNEVHLGIAWSILFLGVFFRYQRNGFAPIYMHLVMIVALAFAVLSHFIAIAILSFLWVYWLLLDRNYTNTKAKWVQLVVYVVLTIIAFQLKMYWGKASGYEADRLKPILLSNIGELYASLSNNGANKMFQLVLSNYWLLIPITLAGLVAQIAQRKWFLLFTTVGGAVAFTAIVCITYPNTFGRELLFYMECEWMALAIVLATPFVVHLLPLINKKPAFALISLVFLIRLGYIANSYSFFHARYKTLNTIADVLETRGIKKAVLKADRSTTDSIFLMTWAVPSESLLLSAIKDRVPQVTYSIVEPGYELPSRTDRGYIDPFSVMWISDVDNKYFNIDSTKAYEVLKLDEVLKQ